MTKYRFTCRCGKTLFCYDNLLGKKISCPHCGHFFSVRVPQKTDSTSPADAGRPQNEQKNIQTQFSSESIKHNVEAPPQKTTTSSNDNSTCVKEDAVFWDENAVVVIVAIISLVIPIIVGFCLHSKWTVVWIVIAGGFAASVLKDLFSKKK